MISLDSETTGLDLRHGARPFLVTVCDEQGQNTCYEWDVDPLTRQPDVPAEDLESIFSLFGADDDTTEIVLQNCKFDITALNSVDYRFGRYWPWERTHDTLLAGHLLASNQPHDLTSMALIYLGINIKPFEDDLKTAVNQARQIARSEYPEWRIANKGLPEMPSAKGGLGGFDYWLPRAIAREQTYPDDHPWWTVCSEYANTDSAVTLPLFKRQKELLIERGLWEIYLERLKILSVVYKMEQQGVTISKNRLDTLRKDYQQESSKAGRICVNVAESFGYELSLPKSGNNNSLRDFVFGPLELPVVKQSKKTGEPSLDAKVIDEYETLLPANSKQLLFVRKLSAKRKRDTALSYMEGYERFWLPLAEKPDWYRLHPSLNPTGTDTLRFSSSNPNEQNISKKEGFNLRYMFGPAPGREWWSMDAQNIELRLPAYEAGETEMIELFSKPNDPPYYGSYHMLILDTLHPRLFAKHGMECKKIFASTWYQWIKNGNFAVQYGAQEYSGTADRAYHIPGAQRRIQQRFQEIQKLSQRMISHAEQYGYVETLPDKTVNPKHGYPLLCTRTSYGKILPTVPLSYHIQGSAMWWMQKAMVRCQTYLDKLNSQDRRGYYMIIQVHDELLFDFPKQSKHENLKHIRTIKRLMEQSGDDFGIPTPVGCEFHETNWSEGVTVSI